ncbi:MAG: hypothetical protein LIO49_01540 [Ruminococcus sp.]|nr:hypothetical protein [Ruminococcus sp.]
MSSILIKFTDHKYVSDFLDGNLYMSSLGKFWGLCNKFKEQKDIFEGVCAVTGIGKNAPFPDDFLSVMASDFRFRIEAYQYCNLLCFYRVDRDDATHIMQGIPKKMDKFGDSVLVIKNRGEFIKRVKASVIKAGGICCMGDVNYHRNAGEKIGPKMYLLSGEGEETDGTFSLDSIGQFGPIKRRYGCLDKEIGYSDQREWRVCYLPKTYDTQDIRLPVGNLRDIVEAYPVSEVRARLMSFGTNILNPRGYVYGVVNRKGQICDGTVSYDVFKETVEKIDGRCRVVACIG